MKLSGRRAARVLTSAAPLLLVAMLAPAQTRHSQPAAPLPAPTMNAPVIGEASLAAKGETRLRKLHLVRPDLIPYPIAFEVYC